MSEHHESAAQLSREHWLQSDELRSLLEQAFLLEENGSEIDWVSLADGNIALAAVAQDVAQLGSMPDSSSSCEFEDGRGSEGANYLGGYQVLRLIGEGGMARVFLALDEALNREVAIKVLDPSFAQDDQRRARFRREAEITATLDHSAIVPIYGIGDDMGHPFIAMKLLEGQSLAALGKHLSPEEIAEIGATLADALHHAHLAGVIHRDVKPSNVILTADGPVLVDFGLAWQMSGQDLTEASSVPGTLAYMSPEQIEGNQGLDPRSDVFALGATLFELLAGKPAFLATTRADVIRLILSENPKSLGLHGRARDLETILLHALDKDRARRFSSAAEMATDLRRFSEGLPIFSRRHSLLERALVLSRRHQKTTAFVGLVLAVIAVLVAVLMFQSWREGQRLERIENQAQAMLLAGELETVLALTRGEDSQHLGNLRLQAQRRLAYEVLQEQVFDFSNHNDPFELNRLMSWAEDLVTNDRDEAAFRDLTLAIAHRNLGDVVSANRSLARFRAAMPEAQAGLLLRDFIESDALGSDPDGKTPSQQEFQSIDDQAYYALILCQSWADLDRCDEVVKRILRRDPAHRQARQLGGRIAFLKGDFELALAYLSGLDRRGRLSLVSLRNIIRCHLALGDEETVMRIYNESAIDDQSLSSTHLRLDMAARKMGTLDFQEILAWTLVRWPEDGHTLVLAASQAFNLQDFARAKNFVDRAASAKLSPYSEINLAQVRIRLALVDIGLASATRGLETNDPRREVCQELMGQVLELRERLPKGLEVWKNIELIELQLRLILGEHDHVLQVLEEGLDLDPQNVDSLNLYLGILGSDYARAAAASKRLNAETMAELAPHFLKAQRYQAVFLNMEGRTRSIREQTLVMHYLRIAFFAEEWDDFDAMAEIFQKECPALGAGQNLKIVESLISASKRRR